jgi:hypothetical protein
MANDPRRDPRAQRDAQLAARDKRQLYPVLELEEDEPQEESYPVGDENDVVISAAMGQGRFFADEPQETTIPVEEWNENHPLWLAFKKGDVKIVQGPDGRDVMVTRDAYVRERGGDLLPTQDYGKPDVAVVDQAASLAQIKYQLAKTLVAYVSTDAPQRGSPLLQLPIQTDTTKPPIGGKILCAALDFGHKGSGEYVIYDVPASQIIKAPFAGSFAKLSARLWPMYYTPDDTGTTRLYFLFPGGPHLTTELWNSVPSALVAQQTGEVNPNPVPCKGWIAEGFLSNDDKNRPIRRFYGSLITDGTIASHATRCPIAGAATYVMLIGGLYDKTNPNLQSLSFLQNILSTTGVATRQIGPFPANTIIALDATCTSIDVINSPNPVGTALAPFEVPFELIYFLSF